MSNKNLNKQFLNQRNTKAAYSKANRTAFGQLHGNTKPKSMIINRRTKNG